MYSEQEPFFVGVFQIHGNPYLFEYYKIGNTFYEKEMVYNDKTRESEPFIMRDITREHAVNW
jgi:hypothetical protein